MKEKSLDTATKISAILTCLSLIIGIGIGLTQVIESLKKANSTLDAIKVESLSNVIDILDFHYDIRTRQVTFNDKKLLTHTNSVKQLLAQGKTGEQVYYSDVMKDFREVAAHYERIAVLINLNYLEFNVIFDIISFPDNFWKSSFMLRQLITENWNGKNRPLDDFLSGFRGLCERYEIEREINGYASAKDMNCDR